MQNKIFYRYFITRACVFLATLALSNFSSALELQAPKQSEDGSFVLRLSSEKNANKVELYRNKDGGSYQKIADAPCFSAISQIVFDDGIYGYKIRQARSANQISQHLNNQQEYSEFSKPVFVQVKRNHKLLPEETAKEAQLSASF